MDGNSFEGLAWELGRHSQYGSLGEKTKMHSEPQLTTPGKAEMHLPFSSDPGISTPPTLFPHLWWQREVVSGPHSHAGHNFDRRDRGTGTEAEKGSKKVTVERFGLPGPLSISIPHLEEPTP